MGSPPQPALPQFCEVVTATLPSHAPVLGRNPLLKSLILASNHGSDNDTRIGMHLEHHRRRPDSVPSNNFLTPSAFTYRALAITLVKAHIILKGNFIGLSIGECVQIYQKFQKVFLMLLTVLVAMLSL